MAIFPLLFGLLQWYSFQVIKTISLSKPWIITYIVLVGLIFSNFMYFSIGYDRSTGWTQGISFSLGLFLALMVFQLILVLFLAFEDLLRLPQALYRFIERGEGNYLPSRRKFISQIALGLAAIPFASLLIGMFRGKYNYKVLHFALTFDDLPQAFDGFTITQISDIHSGSFDNAAKVNYGIDLINKQQSDVILFTGDIVNNKAEELLPWKEAFGRLSAKEGVYSVLGNHDYGDYVNWETKADKEANLQQLFDFQAEMGFTLCATKPTFLKKRVSDLL